MTGKGTLMQRGEMGKRLSQEVFIQKVKLLNVKLFSLILIVMEPALSNFSIIYIPFFYCLLPSFSANWTEPVALTPYSFLFFYNFLPKTSGTCLLLPFSPYL